MSKKNNKSPIIVVEKEVLNSHAWRSLRGVAPQVYMLFLVRRRFEKTGRKGFEKPICINAKELIFPYREAEKKFGITQPRFTRAIDNLVNCGFIDIVEPGNGSAKTPTLYGLSDRWKKYGTADFEPKPRVKIKRGFCDKNR